MGKPPHIWVCPDCGTPNVQVAKWVDPNTDEPIDDHGEEPWCPNCESHLKFICEVNKKSRWCKSCKDFHKEIP